MTDECPQPVRTEFASLGDACDVLKICRRNPFEHRDIKKAYYSLSLKYHPDKHALEEDKARNAVLFCSVQDAYALLVEFANWSGSAGRSSSGFSVGGAAEREFYRSGRVIFAGRSRKADDEGKDGAGGIRNVMSEAGRRELERLAVRIAKAVSLDKLVHQCMQFISDPAFANVRDNLREITGIVVSDKNELYRELFKLAIPSEYVDSLPNTATGNMLRRMYDAFMRANANINEADSGKAPEGRGSSAAVPLETIVERPGDEDSDGDDGGSEGSEGCDDSDEGSSDEGSSDEGSSDGDGSGSECSGSSPSQHLSVIARLSDVLSDSVLVRSVAAANGDAEKLYIPSWHTTLDYNVRGSRYTIDVHHELSCLQPGTHVSLDASGGVHIQWKIAREVLAAMLGSVCRQKYTTPDETPPDEYIGFMGTDEDLDALRETYPGLDNYLFSFRMYLNDDGDEVYMLFPYSYISLSSVQMRRFAGLGAPVANEDDIMDASSCGDMFFVIELE
jgi:hypothetical protein